MLLCDYYSIQLKKPIGKVRFESGVRYILATAGTCVIDRVHTRRRCGRAGCNQTAPRPSAPEQLLSKQIDGRACVRVEARPAAGDWVVSIYRPIAATQPKYYLPRDEDFSTSDLEVFATTEDEGRPSSAVTRKVAVWLWCSHQM